MCDINELKAIVYGGELPVVECSNDKCDNVQTVESDADFLCFECNKGRLTSPLRVLGMI